MNILLEKIDGSQAVEYTKANPTRYHFDIGDLEYTVKFDQDGEEAAVVFTASGEETDDAESYEKLEVGFKNAISIFHTVWVIIKDFLESSLDPIDIIEFSAKYDEPSRVKFYRTLARQLAKEYGYSPADVEETGIYDKSALTFLVPVGQ